MREYRDFAKYIWHGGSADDYDVVVSTRVRLARNLRDYPFTPRLDETGAREIIAKVLSVPAVAKFDYTDFEKLSPEVSAALAERHIVSREFAAANGPRGLLADPEKGLYIMLSEEDHVRIQCLGAGASLEETYKKAAEIENALDSALEFAYSEKFGYLTHCPTNLGTGMRASVMLFLPAITAAKGIGSLQSQLTKLGLTVRGMNGEGSGADGCLYQISNQITLGISEEETVKKLMSVTASIVKRERALRGNLTGDRLIRLKDSVRRSLGIMRYAELLESKEMFDLYAKVRLGATLGMTDGITCEMLDGLLFSSMPAAIVAEAGDEAKSPMDRDALRAAKVRSIMA